MNTAKRDRTVVLNVSEDGENFFMDRGPVSSNLPIDHMYAATSFVAVVDHRPDMCACGEGGLKAERHAIVLLVDKATSDRACITADPSMIVKLYESFHKLLCDTFGSDEVAHAMLASQFGSFADVMLDALQQVRDDVQRH
jgi:hypothetical protein